MHKIFDDNFNLITGKFCLPLYGKEESPDDISKMQFSNSYDGLCNIWISQPNN